MNSITLNKTAGAVHADPAAATKTLFFILLGILFIFILVKIMKGFSRGAELISDFGPTTESEKREIMSNPTYADNLKWLGPYEGAIAFGKAGYKNTDQYLSAKKITWAFISKAADQIWAAKMPGYISETEVYNAINSMPTKAAVSLLAANFNAKYEKRWNGGALNTFLSKYLKVSEMKTLTELISKKPTV